VLLENNRYQHFMDFRRHVLKVTMRSTLDQNESGNATILVRAAMAAP
jgi:hypothetical protein